MSSRMYGSGCRASTRPCGRRRPVCTPGHRMRTSSWTGPGRSSSARPVPGTAPSSPRSSASSSPISWRAAPPSTVSPSRLPDSPHGRGTALAGRGPAVFEEFEDLLDVRTGILPASGECRYLQNEPGECRQAMSSWPTPTSSAMALLEGGGVPRPHASRISRSTGVESTRAVNSAQLRVGRQRDPGREDVLAQRVDDGLTGGGLAHRGDQFRLVVLSWSKTSASLPGSA